jgi:hypothetical protein
MKQAASVLLGLLFYPEDGDVFRNIGLLPTDYAALYSRRRKFLLAQQCSNPPLL